MSTDTTVSAEQAAGDEATLPFRYNASLATAIERRWQDLWEREGTFHTPNPSGRGSIPPIRRRSPATRSTCWTCSPTRRARGGCTSAPAGFIGTDVLGRYLRMNGHNVLHAMGFDAFGLPAEQYAVQTGTHPRKTTEENIARYKAQLRQLGLAHDERRSVATTDVEFYRWTQWIFLKIFESWYDEKQRKRARSRSWSRSSRRTSGVPRTGVAGAS